MERYELTDDECVITVTVHLINTNSSSVIDFGD